MAIAIAEVAATGADLRDDGALDLIVERWNWWARNPKDIGVQTRTVLSNAAERGISAKTARDESSALHERTGRTAGNGSLMRTAPVALAHLDDEEALATAARLVSELTHFDPDAGDAGDNGDNMTPKQRSAWARKLNKIRWAKVAAKAEAKAARATAAKARAA